MKKSNFLRVIVMLITMLIVIPVSSKTLNKEVDTRVQLKGQKLIVSALNKEKSNYSVFIYNRNHELIQKNDLGNSFIVDRIFDFKGSEKTTYMVKIYQDNELIYNKFIYLGTN